MLLLLLALLAAAGFLTLRNGSGPLVPPGNTPAGKESMPSAQDAAEPAEPNPGQTLPGPGFDAQTGTRVLVTVTAEEEFLPPVSPPLLLLRSAQQEPLPTTVLAGVGTELPLRPRRADTGFALLAGDLGAGRIVRRVHVAPGVERGAADGIVGLPAPVAGTVVDAGDRPLAGAHVWLGELAADGAPITVVSDDEGRFEALVASGNGVPLMVQAQGHVGQGQFLDVGLGGFETRLRLSPAVSLTVQVVGVGVAVQSARVFVVPRAAISSDLSSYPFFWQTVSGGMRLDGQGRVVFTDLPRECEVGVVVVLPHVAIAAPRTVRLRDQAEQVVVPLVPTPSVAGQVIDDAGEPVRGVRILGTVASPRWPQTAARRLLPAHVEAVGAWAAFGDSRGQCTISTEAERWRVEAPGHAGRLHAAQFPVVLPRWHGGPLEFCLAAPVAGAVWQGACNLHGGIETAITADAPWQVALPHAGQFTFVIETFVAGERRARSEHEHVLATGPVELIAPQPN